jgi:hypothetical protein
MRFGVPLTWQQNEGFELYSGKWIVPTGDAPENQEAGQLNGCVVPKWERITNLLTSTSEYT